MKNHLRLAPVALFALLLAGCQGPCSSISKIAAPSLTTGSADFTTFVSVGTSISAGWQSGGLVNRHQVHSGPALFAQQVGKTVLTSGKGTFSFPAIDADGIPALTKIQSLSPLIISNAGQVRGNPINLAQATPYNNLAVPGALLSDFDDATNYYSTGTSRDTIFQIIARGVGKISDQSLALAPTFVAFEYGANEVLGPATSGVGKAYMPYTPTVYAALLTGAMNKIHTLAPTAKLALFNVPDVTAIPFFTTFPSFTVSLGLGTPVAINGPAGPLTSGDHITLLASALLAAGHGFPVGAYNYVNPLAPGLGDSLPVGTVLLSSDHDDLTAAIAQMNAAVDSVSLRPWIAKVDLNTLLTGIATNGYPLGGTHYTSAFVTGGLFSLDGIHPSDLGDGLIANAMIDAVNTRFGATIPHVNLTSVSSITASSARPAPVGTDGRILKPFGYVQTNVQGLFPRRR